MKKFHSGRWGVPQNHWNVTKRIEWLEGLDLLTKYVEHPGEPAGLPSLSFRGSPSNRIHQFLDYEATSN